MGNDSGERGGVGDPESVNKRWLPEREARGRPGLASKEGCALFCNKSKAAEAECGWEVCGPSRREESPLGVSNFFMKDGGVRPRRWRRKRWEVAG